MTIGRGFKLFCGLAMMASVVAACGDDEDQDEGADVDSYCELVAELDEAGTEAFAALAEDTSATDADYAAAERQFVEDHADDFATLQEVVPDEIADDVEMILTAQDEWVEGGDHETSPEVASAEERVRAFQAANCGASG